MLLTDVADSRPRSQININRDFVVFGKRCNENQSGGISFRITTSVIIDGLTFAIRFQSA